MKIQATTATVLVLAGLLGGCRGEISRSPPIHPVLDMDFQQKLKAQSESTFAGWHDGRGMRAPVGATVPRGGMPAGAGPGEYYVPETNWIFQSFDANHDGVLSRLESLNSPFHRAALFARVDRNEDGVLERTEVEAGRRIWTYKNADGTYVAANPLEKTLEVLERGRQRFNINCAVCHGQSGSGGMVARRWPVPVLDLVLNQDNDQRVRLINLPPGEIFETITKGKGTMPSYAPQITVEDRWAIIHYLKALQAYFNPD